MESRWVWETSPTSGAKNSMPLRDGGDHTFANVTETAASTVPEATDVPTGDAPPRVDTSLRVDSSEFVAGVDTNSALEHMGGEEEDVAACSLSKDAILALRGQIHETFVHRKRTQVMQEQLVAQGDQIRSLEGKVFHLNDKLCDANRELGLAENRLETSLGEHRKERARLMSERKELRTRCAKLEGLDANYNAQYKRLEQDYEKLQTKLSKMMHGPGGVAEKDRRGIAVKSLKSKPKPLGMSAKGNTNRPQSQTRARGGAKASSAEDKPSASSTSTAVSAQSSIESKLVATYVEKEKQMVAENERLHASLRELCEKVASIEVMVPHGAVMGEAPSDAPVGGGATSPFNAADPRAHAQPHMPRTPTAANMTTASMLDVSFSFTADLPPKPVNIAELSSRVGDLHTRFQHFHAADSGTEPTTSTPQKGGLSLSPSQAPQHTGGALGEGDAAVTNAHMVRELHTRLKDAEFMLAEQDQLLYAAIALPTRISPSQGASSAPVGGTAMGGEAFDGGFIPSGVGDLSWQAELDEEMEQQNKDLAKREAELARKEDELTVAQEKLDRERMEFERNGFEAIFGRSSVTPERSSQLDSSMSRFSPIHAPFAATPRTKSILGPGFVFDGSRLMRCL